LALVTGIGEITTGGSGGGGRGAGTVTGPPLVGTMPVEDGIPPGPMFWPGAMLMRSRNAEIRWYWRMS